MPILGSRGAAGAKAFGLSSGAKKVGIEYVVLAGGGGGGFQSGPGGGAGGFRTNFPGGTELKITYGKAIDVTIGNGSSGSPSQGRGGDSKITEGTDLIVASGGGHGNNDDPTFGVGGSGAGGHRGNVGDFSPVEGHPGGSPGSPAFSPSVDWVAPSTGFGGGGGGASVAGSFTGIGGNPGGNGATTTITGSPLTHAGGGSGGSHNPYGPGSGGSGGGGPGGSESTPGQAASGHGSGGGGGGGGPSSQNAPGGPGSGGRAIIRTPSAYTITATPPSNPTGTTPTGEKYAIFNSTGTFTIT
jgi:hypothetical protein